jgi:hypothetical protein
MEARPECRSGTCDVTRSFTVPQPLRARASAASPENCESRVAMILFGLPWKQTMDTHMNGFPIIRFVILIACLLFAGCASEEPLNFEEHAPVAGEATPAHVSGARTGWAW